MKLNKKIIIPAITLMVGTTLAGSVASTVAWYQYSTRTNVSYIGTSAGTIGNLQIRLAGGEWGTRLSIRDVNSYLLSQGIGQQVEPVTPGALSKNEALKKHFWQKVDAASGTEVPAGNLGKDYYVKTDTNALYAYDSEHTAWNVVAGATIDDGAPDNAAGDDGDLYVNSADQKVYKKVFKETFYSNPIAGFGPYEKWIKASSAKYVKLPLQLRFIAEDEAHLSAEDVYLSKLVIQEDMHNDDVEAHGDISDAVRIHFSAYEEGDEEHAVSHLVSKNGGTTLTHGKLRLEGGNDFDKAYTGDDEFGFDGSELAYINYGGVEGVQTSYSAKVNAEDGVYYEEEVPANGWKAFGAVIEAAAGAPDAAAGVVGDYYLDSTASEEKLYKKTAVNTWTVFSSSVKVGNADPDLETGTEKQYFVNGLNIFECGYHNEEISPALVSTVDDSLEIDDITADKKIGSTIATVAQPDPQTYLNVDVTIWIEGWHKFNRSNELTSIWDQDLIGAMFDVGFQFAVQDR